MTFGFPAFFWAALALLPLAAVYFIKIRPRRQPVNAFSCGSRFSNRKHPTPCSSGCGICYRC
jgi:hypothetical protein